MAKNKRQSPEKEPAGFLRLKVPLNEDGSPNLDEWDAHDKTKEKYRTLINSPEFKKKIGLTGVSENDTTERERPSRDASETAPAAVDKEKKNERELVPDILLPSDVVWVFDVYSAICAVIFCNILKCDFDLIYPVVKFDDEQKKALADPLATCIMKYVPAEYLFYIPEFRLLTMLATITGTNFSRAREIAQKNKPTEKSAPASTTHVTVMDKKQEAS